MRPCSPTGDRQRETGRVFLGPRPRLGRRIGGGGVQSSVRHPAAGGGWGRPDQHGSVRRTQHEEEMPDMTAPAASRGPAWGPAMGIPTLLATSGLDVLDDLRRSAGRLLDTLGHAPRTTPSSVVDLAPGVRLHTYPDADPSGPPVLLVPAPIKRCYIFDLDPRCSVVARCLRHGLQPHLVEWTDPEPDQQRLGLDDYADGLLRHCLRAVADRTGARRVPLVGHSLGGTLAALCAARYPDLVAGVALLEAPLHFGSHTARLDPLITTPTPTPGPTIGLLDAFPNGVPGSLLTL